MMSVAFIFQRFMSNGLGSLHLPLMWTTTTTLDCSFTQPSLRCESLTLIVSAIAKSRIARTSVRCGPTSHAKSRSVMTWNSYTCSRALVHVKRRARQVYGNVKLCKSGLSLAPDSQYLRLQVKPLTPVFYSTCAYTFAR